MMGPVTAANTAACDCMQLSRAFDDSGVRMSHQHYVIMRPA